MNLLDQQGKPCIDDIVSGAGYYIIPPTKGREQFIVTTNDQSDFTRGGVETVIEALRYNTGLKSATPYSVQRLAEWEELLKRFDEAGIIDVESTPAVEVKELVAPEVMVEEQQQTEAEAPPLPVATTPVSKLEDLIV